VFVTDVEKASVPNIVSICVSELTILVKNDTNEKLPFSAEGTPQKELIINRGESYKIRFKVSNICNKG
jgi:hypothetical protein